MSPAPSSWHRQLYVLVQPAVNRLWLLYINKVTLARKKTELLIANEKALILKSAFNTLKHVSPLPPMPIVKQPLAILQIVNMVMFIEARTQEISLPVYYYNVEQK